MAYHDKLRLYLKKNNISQVGFADRLGHSPAMISRFLSGTSVFDANFITALVREYPDVDLKYIFSDQEDETSKAVETAPNYSIKENDIIKELEIIEGKISSIKSVLAQSCHKI
jgi:transcriptional regulator with XRE-family HTH domain